MKKYSSGGKFSAGAANITQVSIHRINFPPAPLTGLPRI
ncbi:hypothetical protein SRB521_02614 [Intestinimonas butyriciproducens]|nr:hypothetical protein SRB521_02614 [Intestinimonas butyriciproducens]